MIKRSSNCAICENTNRACICSACVNHRLIEYNTLLKSLKTRRDSLLSRLSHLLESKGKADDQKNWRLIQNEKLLKLKKKLKSSKELVTQGKVKIERGSCDLKVKYGVLDSARSTLEKIRVEQVEKYFPNLICTQSLGHMAISSERLHKQSVVVKQICKLFPLRRVSFDGESQNGSVRQYDVICNSRLPSGLDPHSIPSEELAVSLGYMVQLLNLVVQNVAAPALHSSGFAGSCSRIWQRDSYWDARTSTRSNEYPLFIPRRNYCSTSVENSWTDKNSSNFGVASMESDRKEPRLDSTGRNSFKYSSASPHSIESHRDLQKGIALLKKSVACLTAYCYNSLSLEVPPEASTFEAFAKLLATLSSSKEVRSVVSLKMASSRSCKAQQLNKSIWNAHSVISSSLLESAHLPRNTSYNQDPNSAASYLSATESSTRKNYDMNGWDLVEHPKYPPPPSQSEDVEHWTRAMFIDAKKK
ncbi:UV radiation resistance protein/autophagy-related protein 14 [Arabidopsis thaliana x Arabidopsis arenosa]|uniref:UV radiation resistance protein/autophagy-related protein 14 n=1 Tax=Arabidopsis thaliana x Arabidopsis arenosa TaxID=1240361 RepID=A0A8T1Z3G1_9BRAS|nr:UV radiation resistance protein/autophagy-related protein 14 [Arabidopsis thaliana x Arabidopsis arenosa]